MAGAFFRMVRGSFQRLRCSLVFPAAARLFFACFLTVAAAPFCPAEAPDYPRIVSMEAQAGDVAFRQYQEDVKQGRHLVFNRRRKESDEEVAAQLAVYAYETAPTDDLLRLAARCSVPYAAIATLNALDFTAALGGRLVLLPSIPGLYIREQGGSDFERLLLAARSGEGVRITARLPDGTKEAFRFIPGGDFSPTERSLFLHPALFHLPLRDFTVTSRFGSRVSPVSGKNAPHRGVDLAAPQGAPVYAARDGVVSFAGENAVYGNYVVITHDNGWTSLYGHLSAIETALHKKVQSGSLVGRVGSTGLSTGPHLHFELRQNGKSYDPSALMPGRGL
jgi:murein DD-endopeptidase MepM/ murein hydrolase activator NlpD